MLGGRAGRIILACALAGLAGSPSALAPISVDYPLDGSVFPPEIVPPTFLWRDAAQAATAWSIEVTFPDGSAPLHADTPGEGMRVGEIDPRCVSSTNELPKLTPEQAAAHTWTPGAAAWDTIKRHSIGQSATITITGLSGGQPVSRGMVVLRTSKDPVGAPIFYRDVPLMPSELTRGVIKPLAPVRLPLIAWRLRDVGEPRSRLLMEGLHTCANCHSFSGDGKTMGMDLDGPQNDKGLYAVVPVQSKVSIRNEDVISWKSFRGQMLKDQRVGYLSQVSPDGRYVVTATQVEYYVANFRDYRFLQVFYPTRGILAWYSREDGKMSSLPGADDPRYVQANAVWSPDGQYLVFSRAASRDPYPAGYKPALYAGDPNEIPLQYDLYRIPFNQGKGGRAEPVAGASGNGMSNSFPKVSPDGRWIVFVQSRNGQLMRPDGQLYIVPAAGGRARRMRCNTPLMNSWHSFSPNGRWMVFSSKSRSPYTQLFLTHIDEEGNDSPAILIENTTAANRAANIPEFLNLSAGGLLSMDAPAAEFYRICDNATELTVNGQLEAAAAEWARASALEPEDARVHNGIGALLLRQGKLEEAAARFRKALAAEPAYGNAYENLGLVLLYGGKLEEAIDHFRKALEINPDSPETRVNLGGAFLLQKQYQAAVAQLREALRLEPDRVPVLNNLAWILATCPDLKVRNGAEAVQLAERAVRLSGGGDPVLLDTLGAAYAEAGRYADSVRTARRAMALATQHRDSALAAALETRIGLYESNQPFHTPK